MTALWTQVELSALFGAAPSNPLSATVGGVSIDSRTSRRATSSSP